MYVPGLIIVTNITNYIRGEKIVIWRIFGKLWEILEKIWEISGDFEKFWKILPQFTRFHGEKN